MGCTYSWGMMVGRASSSGKVLVKWAQYIHLSDKIVISANALQC